jgi:hypothetical protein
MKHLITTFFVGLVASAALAAEPSHWVQIGNGVGVANAKDNGTTSTLVYLDDANVFNEDGYNGFEVRWVFPTEQTAHLLDGTDRPFLEMYTIVEYNCHTQDGRGKRTYMLSVTDGSHIAFSEDWRAIPAGSGAAAILDAVKTRGCFKAN